MKTSTKRPKRIKAVLFGSHSYGWKWDLPADAESYERMVEQMASTIRRNWTGYADKDVRLALRAIGITPKKGIK